MWIGLLAGTAALVVGGVALASGKPNVPPGALSPAVAMNNAINQNGYR
jgi:hypothetical protein